MPLQKSVISASLLLKATADQSAVFVIYKYLIETDVELLEGRVGGIGSDL